MGLSDKKLGKDDTQNKLIIPKIGQLNKRSENRYEIGEIAAFDPLLQIELGVITEISISGLRIKKPAKVNLEDPKYQFNLHDTTFKARPIWQDEVFIGMRFIDQQIKKELIKRLTKKIDAQASIKKSKALYESIKRYSGENVLSSLINLMVELESSETDIIKLKKYIEQISVIYTKIYQTESPLSNNEDQDQSTDQPSDAKNKIKEDTLIDLQTQLIDIANSPDVNDGQKTIEVKDIDFAIARIGLSTVKDISVRFVKRMITKAETTLSNFKDFELYNILKTVMFKKLTPFFSFHDDNGIGCSLLSIETVGIDFLASKTKTELSDFYVSPKTIYSELSRLYERHLFGTDLLKVDKIFLETVSPVFGSLYDGYIISHQILNLSLSLEDDIKLDLSRKKLNYSYLLFMSYLLCQFYIGRDNESGAILHNRLYCTGMDKQEIQKFLRDTISEANKIADDFGLKSLIKDAANPTYYNDLRRFFPEDIRYTHFLNIIKGLKQHKRAAIRFEDDDYTHFILNKLLNIPDFEMFKLPYAVISCDNLSVEDNIGTETFNFFGLIIFKNIDKIPGVLAKGFIKLWREFEGIIITTYSNDSFIEFERNDLFKFLRQYMADFPSYFVNPVVHHKMIDHTADYLKPIYIIDKESYQMDFMEKTCSMRFIKVETINQFTEEHFN